MKFPTVIMLLLLLPDWIDARTQSESIEFRVKKTKFSEGIGDGYTTEYFYDHSGRVTRVVWEYIHGGIRLPMGKRKTEYQGDLVVCTYFPNESIKKEFLVKNYYFKNIKAGDVDSIFLKDGKVHEVIQLRNAGSKTDLTRHKFKYSGGDLLLSETIINISDTVVRTFQYGNGVLIKASQKSKSLKMQVSAYGRSSIDSLIVLFKKRDVPRGEVFYISEYEDNILRSIREPLTRNAYFFDWDNSNNLTCFSKRSETGFASVRYEYEQGSGNAAIFQRHIDLIDYFFPKPSW